MNLTFIISSLKPGGAERVITDLANYSLMQGHKVSLLTLDSPDAIPFYPLDSKVQLVQLNQSAPSQNPFKRLYNIVKRIALLHKTLRLLKPDVCVSFVDLMNITTLMASVNLKIPIIVSERTHPAHHPLPRFYQLLRNIFYPKARRVVVQTNSVADFFKNLSNVFIIPNGIILPSKTKQASNHNLEKIISVGRLCPFKGFDTLIQAFASLVKKYPHLTLTIYGEGAERQNLEQLIQSLNLDGKVFLPGVTNNVQEKLLDADLFVFPSRYEGFPNALCEAMAVGLPVVASNCSGNVDIVQDGIDGLLFPVGDITALTQKIEGLINDSQKRKNLSSNALKVCERFHPDQIYSLWNQVISDASRS